MPARDPSFGEYSADLIRLQTTTDLSCLSDSERAVLNAVMRRYGSITSKELSDMSHVQSCPMNDRVSVIGRLRQDLS